MRDANGGNRIQDMVTQADLGNPLGQACGRGDLHTLLAGFGITESCVRLFELLLGGRTRQALERLPQTVREALRRRAGWYLHARAQRSTDRR
ncbi:MAG: hypothetical protein AMXMBFR64_62690 [Myxococcales bacterium]